MYVHSLIHHGVSENTKLILMKLSCLDRYVTASQGESALKEKFSRVRDPDTYVGSHLFIKCYRISSYEYNVLGAGFPFELLGNTPSRFVSRFTVCEIIVLFKWKWN